MALGVGRIKLPQDLVEPLLGRRDQAINDAEGRQGAEEGLTFHAIGGEAGPLEMRSKFGAISRIREISGCPLLRVTLDLLLVSC